MPFTNSNLTSYLNNLNIKLAEIRASLIVTKTVRVGNTTTEVLAPTISTSFLSQVKNLYLTVFIIQPASWLLNLFTGVKHAEPVKTSTESGLLHIHSSIIDTEWRNSGAVLASKMLAQQLPYAPSNVITNSDLVALVPSLVESLNFWTFDVVVNPAKDFLADLVLEALATPAAQTIETSGVTNASKLVSKISASVFGDSFNGVATSYIVPAKTSGDAFADFFKFKNNAPVTLTFINGAQLELARAQVKAQLPFATYAQVETWPSLNVLRPALALTSTQNDELSTHSFRHPFHLVDPSPWPFLLSIALFSLTLGTVSFWQQYETVNTIKVAIILVTGILTLWWRDVIRESTYEKVHTAYVRRGLLFGMTLFIISEIMFFAGFFWGFLHSSLVPSSSLGGVWPPVQLMMISPWKLPLLNTALLLTSGVTLTIAHKYLREIEAYTQYRHLFALNRLLLWLGITSMLGVIFLGCQAFEYYYSPFTLQDTVYASAFYMLTGLHGMHVLVGTIFLLVCLWRAYCLHFTYWKQVGLKSAIWYWHFVDVVWLGLFLLVYVWGS